jgi:Mg-chelatase subunit ChlD
VSRSGAGGLVLRASGDGARARSGPQPPGSAEGTFTDDPAELALLEQQQEALPGVKRIARVIAEHLSVPRPRRTTSSRRGRGVLASVPYRGGSDDIDLDATIGVLAERPVPEEEDIIVRERIEASRAVVLIVDVSGSARGDRIATAAAAVGALAGELTHDRLGVIAFWSDAAVLLRLGEPVNPGELLDALLRIPARGLTNVAFPLELAAAQLAGARERDARAILLSDCVHNAGPDPRPLAARLPRLDVLLDVTGERDVELGQELAAAGRGRFRTITGYRDVAPALTDFFRR